MPPWWQDAVVYQVYPRSFADANGDGVGDLPGLRSRLDHLQWLGVDAVWLSPFYPSPMADFGYDVSDYRDVDPVFGSLDDFDALVRDAHARGIRVLVDWVPNHTSSEHPWFAESRRSRDSPKRDWYVWRDGRDGRPPNNWRSAFGGPAWTWDEATGQWYLHLFLREQPDLNWTNPAVVAAMHDVLRFWLQRDVDGFRIDVVHLIGKDPLLPDQEPELGDVGRFRVHDDPNTHELIRGLRSILAEFDDERVLVGEVSLRDTLRISTYYGAGEGLHLAFNFLSLDVPWKAAEWKTLISVVGRDLGVGAWPTWVLSNHDTSRHRTRYGGSEAVARAAAVLVLGLRGTPFLFQGEELGLADAVDSGLDPGGRDPCRAPIPWHAPWPHGWPAPPWLPFPPEAGERAVDRQAQAAGSILWLYRDILHLRRSSSALTSGTLELLDAPEDVLCHVRAAEDGDVRVVAVNFAPERRRLEAIEGRCVDISSVPGRGGNSDGVLLPNEAVVTSGAGS